MIKVGILRATVLGSIMQLNGDGYHLEVYQDDKGNFLVKVDPALLKKGIRTNLIYEPKNKENYDGK